jgi:hypothetical protein
MSNRGSFTHTRGDAIYGVELTHGNGETAFKSFPSLQGLKAGLRAIDSDIERWKYLREGWVVVKRDVFICTPDWQPFDPESP